MSSPRRARGLDRGEDLTAYSKGALFRGQAITHAPDYVLVEYFGYSATREAGGHPVTVEP